MNVPMTEPKDVLAEALHDAMCDISHHDRPPARCSRWATYPNIAASVLPRLRGYALVRTPETLPGLDAVIDAVAVLFIEHAPTANVGEVRLALEAVRAAATPSPTPPEGLRTCRICGEVEPVHVHNGDERIEDYFTVGRGETDFQAAVRWKHRALAASLAPDPGATWCATCGHERRNHSSGGMCDGAGTECYCVRFPDAPDFATPVADTAGIDAAWREAEAALPEGAWLYLAKTSKGRYGAQVRGVKSMTGAAGDSPAAALRALTVRIHERATND